jgi:MFS family permease
MGGGGPLADGGEALQARIDESGFGPFQLLMLLLTGGIMFAEGAEMLVMGSITTLLHDHWELNAIVRGTMVSVVFVGFSCGNLVSGMIGDVRGRKASILLAYMLIGGFGMLTSTAWSPAVMVSLRFFVGVGCGVGFPSVYSLIPEVCPTHMRGIISAIMIGFMPGGELFAAFLVYWIDPNLEQTTEHCELGYDAGQWIEGYTRCSWRSLCLYSALPAFVFFTLALVGLRESPHFLMARGRTEEAEKVLNQIDSWNHWPSPAPKKEPLKPKEDAGKSGKAEATNDDPGAFAVLSSPKYFMTTAFMCIAHFVKDFSVFGLAYVFPQYFAGSGKHTVAHHLIVTALLAIPGVAIAVAVMRTSWIGHITAMRTAAGLTSLMALGMLEASPEALAVPCAYALKFVSLVFFIVTVIYTAEVFPSKYRNTSVGYCTAVGRVGSISAPLLFELSMDWSDGSFDFFLTLVASFMGFIAVAAGFALSIETKGKALATDVEDYGSTKGA